MFKLKKFYFFCFFSLYHTVNVIFDLESIFEKKKKKNADNVFIDLRGQHSRIDFYIVQNNVRKEENVGHKHLLFPHTVFGKLLSGSINLVI